MEGISELKSIPEESRMQLRMIRGEDEERRRERAIRKYHRPRRKN